MKRSDLVTGIMFIFGGIVLFFVGVLTNSVLDTLLLGFSEGAACAGIVMICKYFYWNFPKNKERSQERIANEEIEIHDELKIKLREKSGQYAYILGLISVSISIVIFSVLGDLGIVNNSRMIVLYLGGYLVFQIIANIVIFNYLIKRY